MLFNSYGFLFYFLPATWLVFWRLRTKTQRHLWLTLTGYAFYASWNWRFCGLMLASTLIAYLAGYGMLAFKNDQRLRRAFCFGSVTIDLALLAYFKYANFALGSAASLASALGLQFAPPVLDIVLPIGISFYTFHTISYVVDVYRGAVQPTRDFPEFACYVSFFPQLVAGPIVRFRQVEGDLEQLDKATPWTGWPRGWSFFALGFIKKVLVADTLAALVDPAWAPGLALSTPAAWLCALGYTYQLYFDFSGYSDMAVGLGLLFGVRLPQNFDSPYKATSPSDFWRRWHISLSTVLRDYLYIPLGGSRGSAALVYRNLFITMLLGGLWHGASWTFVVWGAFHGLLLVLQRALGDRRMARVPTPLRALATFVLVVVGWVFFRAATLEHALDMLAAMFVPQAGTLPSSTASWLACLCVAAGVAHLAPNTFELRHQWSSSTAACIALLFLAALLTMYGTTASPFLYFQF